MLVVPPIQREFVYPYSVSARCPSADVTMMEQGHTIEEIVDSMTYKFKATALVLYWNRELT